MRIYPVVLGCIKVMIQKEPDTIQPKISVILKSQESK